MKKISVKDLEYDVLEGKYLEVPLKIYFKDGKIIESIIDSYSYDDDPFCNYVEIKGEEMPFDEIEKIELINYEDR